MRILVTGGAGFIGSHVVDALVAKEHEVHVLDNLSSGLKENVHEKATLHEGDITDFSLVEKLFDELQPEAIFHLAAQIDVRKSVADPVSDAQTNILASINLIRLSAEKEVKKFIFSSTGGAIYGDTDERPTPETHSEWPLSPYGIGKLTVDKYLHFAREVLGLPSISLRYANVYGPRQNPHGEAGVVAIFLNRMLQGENPHINGDGTQTRDYVYVGDVAKANILALEKNVQGVYNVGTGAETDVNELFSILNTFFDNRFEEKHRDALAGEQLTSSLDASKIAQDLDWKPKTPLEEGLEKTHEWFRDHQK